jgi:hypothetical protein
VVTGMPRMTSGPENDGEERSAEHRAMVGRIWLFSIAGYVIFALYVALRRGWWPLAALTCSALVSMINFLWLEEIAVRILRPAPRVSGWRMGCRALARFTLFGAAVSIFMAHFDALSVLLGFSVIVVGIMGEALYGATVHRPT